MKALAHTLLLSTTALGQPTAPDPSIPAPPVAPADPITIDLEPSAWYAAPGGDLRLPGSAGQADLKDVNLDSPRLSPFVELRARKGPWSLELSGFAFSASDRGATSTGLSIGAITIPTGPRTSASLDTSSFEAALGHTVHTYRGDLDELPLDVRLDVTGGLRTHTVDVTISSAGAGTAQADAFFAEPSAGILLRVDLPRRFSIDLDASFGAFFLDDHAAISWDVLVGFTWRPVDELALQVGYRQLAFALEDGPTGDQLRWRGAMAGLYTGLVFRF